MSQRRSLWNVHVLCMGQVRCHTSEYVYCMIDIKHVGELVTQYSDSAVCAIQSLNGST